MSLAGGLMACAVSGLGGELGHPGQHAEVRIGQADGGGDVLGYPGADRVGRELPGAW